MADKKQEFYKAFRKWAIGKYGQWAVLSQAKFTKNEFEKSAEYQEWVKEGYPGWTTPTPEAATKAKEAEAEKLPPRFGEKKWLGDDYYEFKDGKWHKITPPEGAMEALADFRKTVIPTPTPPTGGGEVRVETINGVLGTARYENGVLTDFEPISSATTQRDWTPETLALEKEKFAWTKSQAEAALARQPELQRQQMELQFEKDRNELIRGIPSNDWVRRFFVENQPNPYKAQDTTTTSLADLEKGLDQRTADVQYRQQILSNAIMGGADEDTIAKLKDLRDQASAKRDVYYDAWKTQKTESRDWTAQPQIYPEAPSWLPYYVPGVTAGKMITPQEVPTPSGQQLTAMPTNLLESLASYSKWAGGQMWRPLSDEVRRIRESAALMQPETPRGAGRFGWTPAGR